MSACLSRCASESPRRADRTDLPDFVLGDASLFVAVFGEVKLPHQELSEIARSTEGHDQIGRYLAQTGVVLICSVRAFGLLVARPGYPRTSGIPVPSAERELLATVDLWDATPVKPATVHQLIDIVARSVTDFAPLADPADLAKVLARQARDAKEALPADLRPLDRSSTISGRLWGFPSTWLTRRAIVSSVRAWSRPRFTACSPPGYFGIGRSMPPRPST